MVLVLQWFDLEEVEGRHVWVRETHPESGCKRVGGAAGAGGGDVVAVFVVVGIAEVAGASGGGGGDRGGGR
jgi:hypothetical protein